MTQTSNMAVANLYSRELKVFRTYPVRIFAGAPPMSIQIRRHFPRQQLELYFHYVMAAGFQIFYNYSRETDMLTCWQRHEFNNGGRLQFNIDTKQTDGANNM